MQPYFFPYGGYYRLLLEADTFLLFDCVQFPRRGRVHRCALPTDAGTAAWLTLPLAPAPRDTPICEMRFAADARTELTERMRRFGWLAKASGPLAPHLREHLEGPLTRPIDFLADGLALANRLLSLGARLRRTSELGLPARLKGQERVIAAVEAVGGTDYINPPGGRHIYDPARFAEAGLTLRFQPDYGGAIASMLHGLATLDAATIRADIENSL